jgi:hypothetical protein
MLLRLSLARVAALATLTIVLLVPAAAGAVVPPQGLYEECAPSNQQQCAGELRQMGSAGFRLALNYTAWYGSAADLDAYAAEAQAAGMKVIWPLNAAAWRDPGWAVTLRAEYPALASSCGCANNAAFLRYVVAQVGSLPATWGYYVGDELGPSAGPQVAALSAQVRALDPHHPRLLVGQPFPSLAANLQPFLGSADAVGADMYPIGRGLPPSAVGDVAKALSSLASASSRRAAMVLQAFSWAQYPNEINAVDPRWPTEAEMRTMRDDALLVSPSMLLWYSLSDIERSDAPAQHWHDLVIAAFGPPAATSAAARHRRHRRHGRHGGRHRRGAAMREASAASADRAGTRVRGLGAGG